ncbi:MAG: tyrosine-type recombinase/integrase [Eubacterium sp.]|jgi:integrase/recombinase XerD
METTAFEEYLRKTKKASENTITAYTRDIAAFEKYMNAHRSTAERASKTDIVTYIMELDKKGRSRSTSNRKLASLRAYYEFLIGEGRLTSDPTKGIKTPRAERGNLEYLTIEEVDNLLSQPDDSVKGKRDRAILEVLYGTGIRVMELIELDLKDLNLRMGFITCSGEHGRARIVPLGSYARNALTAYLETSRPALMRSRATVDDPSSPLFINYAGERFTRQGLWKVLKSYGKAAGIEDKISPHILRTSFAVHMIQNGADIKTLQELMGYDDMQALQVFVQMTNSRIKDVYDKTHPRA